MVPTYLKLSFEERCANAAHRVEVAKARSARIEARQETERLSVTDRTAHGHRLGYDPVAEPDAEAHTKAFFDKLLKQ